MKMNIHTLPWFSSEEWLDVYQSAFESNNQNLYHAYAQLCVWKSRVDKLPVAIEATFPLLRGMLALQDDNLQDFFKHSLITSSVSRFVSILHQAYMKKADMNSKILYGMDNTINLPPFLYQIRNLLVHQNEVMGAKETLYCALEAAVQWIKSYYWEDEAAKIQNRHSNQSKKKYIKKVKSKATEATPTPLRMQQWEESAIEYRTHILHKLKDPSETTRKVKAQFFRNISYMSKAYPHYCARRCFQIFFCSTEMYCNPSQLEEINHCKFCNHSYSLTSEFLNYSSFVMKFFDVNIFIKEVIGNAQSHPKICFDWFQILMNTVEPKKRCRKHFFPLTTYLNDVDWKSVIFQLLSLCVKWSLTIGFRMLNCNLVRLKPQAKMMLIQLVKKYQCACEEDSTFHSEEDSPAALSEGGTLQDLMKTVSLNSLQLPLDKLSSACQKVNTDVEVKAEFGNDYCLGILPHQVGDPYFFKKLILNPKNSVRTS